MVYLQDQSGIYSIYGGYHLASHLPRSSILLLAAGILSYLLAARRDAATWQARPSEAPKLMENQRFSMIYQ